MTIIHNRFFISTVFIFAFSRLCAQQLPQYTQYVANNFVLNPAIAGIENYVDVRIARREQWVGISGAPVTTYFSIHTPLGSHYLRPNPNTVAGIGENPFSRSYLQNYQAEENHHGMGMIYSVDKTGPFNRTDMSLNYAYHIGLSEYVNMSVGIAPAVTIMVLDKSFINTKDPDDASINSNSNKLYFPNVDAGIWLYGSQFFAGVSALRLIPQTMDFTKVSTLVNKNYLLPHFFATAGFRFSFIEDVTFQPSFMLKYVNGTPTSLDFNLKTHFKDIFWTGISYRTTDAFAFMVGINPVHYLNISYSYDMISSALSAKTWGSNEIVIGLLLSNSYKVRCPKKMW